MARAVAALPAPGVAAMSYNPATQIDLLGTASSTVVDAANVVLPIVMPDSGKALIEVEAWVNLTNAATNYLWSLQSDSGSIPGGGLQRVAIGVVNQRIRCRWVITGTAGAVLNVRLWHLAANAQGGGIRVGAPNGYTLTMTSSPVI